MKKLVIVGAGRFGREVHAWARQSRGHGEEWVVAGFLDHRARVLDGYGIETPILGGPDTFEPGPEHVFACALGDPAAKRHYSDLLVGRGARFLTLVHSSVVVGDHVRIGSGVILCPRAVVSSHVTMGDFVTLNVGVFVGHDACVGPYTQVHGNVTVNGAVRVGAGVTVGCNAAILPDLAVGDGATIGAGSVVIRDVGAGTTVFGNPAKPLGLPSRGPAPVVHP